MSEEKNPFHVLGISRDADENEAKLAYLQLVRLHHPDRGGDARRFVEIQEAWEMLENKLPKSAIKLPPLPSHDDPKFDTKMEEIIAAYLLDDSAASDLSPSSARKKAPVDKGFDAREWTTVGSASSKAIVPAGAKKDWTRLKYQVSRDTSLSLIKMNSEEAAHLLQYYPNACAALKLVQRSSPDLCLYDAILMRAGSLTLPAASRGSTALRIIETAPFDEGACEAALRNPLASIEAAQKHAASLAPYIQFNAQAVNAQKLAMDISFLKLYIQDELMPHLTKRIMPSQGRGIAERD